MQTQRVPQTGGCYGFLFKSSLEKNSTFLIVRVNKTTRLTRACGLVSDYYFYPRLYFLVSDDAGCNGVSFKCDNGTDLDAGADVVWVNDNVWTSFVSCPGKYKHIYRMFCKYIFRRLSDLWIPEQRLDLIPR